MTEWVKADSDYNAAWHTSKSNSVSLLEAVIDKYRDSLRIRWSKETVPEGEGEEAEG